jgi:hypothetical protein
MGWLSHDSVNTSYSMLPVAVVLFVPAEVTLLYRVPLKTAELNVLNASDSME